MAINSGSVNRNFQSHDDPQQEPHHSTDGITLVGAPPVELRFYCSAATHFPYFHRFGRIAAGAQHDAQAYLQARLPCRAQNLELVGVCPVVDAILSCPLVVDLCIEIKKIKKVEMFSAGIVLSRTASFLHWLSGHGWLEFS